MENQTEFDLNRAIQQWRVDLASSPAFHDDNLRELESHLHDSIHTLEAHGLSTEEAFLIATKRIGRGSVLASEFGKINSHTIWLDRILWLLLGAQILAFLPLAGFSRLIQLSIVSVLNNVSFDFRAHSSMATATFVLANLSLFVCSAAFGWLVIRRAGPALVAWAGSRLHRNSTFALVFAAFSLLHLFNYGVGFAANYFFSKGLIKGLIASGGTESLIYSTTISQLVQVFIFLGLTLVSIPQTPSPGKDLARNIFKVVGNLPVDCVDQY